MRCTLLLGAVACGGGTSTGTHPNGPPCLPANTTLAPLAGATFDCSAGGTTIALAGGGATYLVVPQFAVGNVPYQRQSFVLSRQGTASPGAASTVATRASLATPPRPNRRQAAFDARMRAMGRRIAAVAAQARVTDRPRAAAATPPTLGSTRSFFVFADTTATTHKSATATLEYIGTNIYVYLDNASPANGFSAGQLQAFGQLADQVLYQLVVSTFADPTDIDQNGHLIMLLSPSVNGLTPAKDCATEGFVAGYFDPTDLTPSLSGSNDGEIFYALVPDPTGAANSCPHTVATVDAIVPGTFMHELQHLINYGQHVLIHGGQAEEGWLDEGMSIVATELGARYYNAKYPPTGGRLFTDSAEAFIVEQINDSYDYLTDPDTVSLTLHTDADCCLAWRSGDWLLLRYLGDQNGATFYHALETSTVTGTANIAGAAGQPFPTLFGAFGVAAYTDSLPGVARGAIPAPYRFSSYNLRQLYHTLDGGTAAFPVVPKTLPPGTELSGSIVPGTSSYYLLTTSAGSGSVTIGFATSTGAALPVTLHPQVNVFRVQ